MAGLSCNSNQTAGAIAMKKIIEAGTEILSVQIEFIGLMVPEEMIFEYCSILTHVVAMETSQIGKFA